jgi:glycosyltransferase involved in cell wall biosynthesis
MRIVLATPIYLPEIGGPATYTKEICERLGAKHEITVVAYARNGAPYGTARLVQIPKDRSLPIRLFAFFRAVLREARTADVIYAQNAVAAGLPAVLAGMLRRKPVIIKFVGDEAWERATQLRRTEKLLEDFLTLPDGTLRTTLMMMLQGWVLRRAARVTTPSRYLRDLIVKAYRLNPARAVVNYNAADDHGAPVFSPEHIPHRIVMTARLTAWKGIDGMLRALPLVRAKYPDATLVVAGDGPERAKLEALAKELNIESAVSFLGNVSRTETWQLRKESDVYVLNSTYEGLPHTVLTSFAAGIPVVATDIPGTNEAVHHEIDGLLVPPNDPEALARALLRIFDDPALGERLVSGGTKTLQDIFSWSAHLSELERLLSVR